MPTTLLWPQRRKRKIGQEKGKSQERGTGQEKKTGKGEKKIGVILAEKKAKIKSIDHHQSHLILIRVRTLLPHHLKGIAHMIKKVKKRKIKASKKKHPNCHLI